MLNQPYLEEEEKKSNVYLGNYSELRVKIFQYMYKEFNELGFSEKKVSLVVDDLLEIIDKETR
mgnify:CR=1 FL=1